MSVKGYDVFYTAPDTEEEMYCKVCGTRCSAERSLHGPTSWAEGQARRGHWHDRFICPHSQETWHEQALELAIQISEMPSQRVAAMMKLDLEDLLRENLPA